MRIRPLLVLAVAAALGLTASAATHPVTLLDVMSLKGVGTPVISPDGHWALFTVRSWTPDPATQAKPVKETTVSHVWLVSVLDPTGTGAARQITWGEKGESDPQWSPDGKFISFVAQRAGEAPAERGAAAAANTAGAQIFLMRADGGEARPLTTGEGGAGMYAWSPDSKTIAFLRRQPLGKAAEAAHQRGDDVAEFEGGFRQSHIWTVDVASGKETPLTTGVAMTVKSAPVWSPDGSRMVFEASPTPLLRDDRNRLYLLTVAGHEVRPLTGEIANTSSPAWSPDGRTIAYDLAPNQHKALGDGIPLGDEYPARLMLLDVATGASHDAASPNFDLAAGAPIWTPDGKAILFTTGDRVYRDVFRYELASGRYTQITHNRLVGLADGGFSRDGARAVFTLQSADAPADVYTAGTDFAAPRKLTTVNPQAAGFSLGQTAPFEWKSSDGWAVEGVLVKPVGYVAGKRVPLLVNVHGGPTGSFSANFNAEAQYWAGKGWAVLYPNPRGSTGYGEKFLRGNILDWGGGDYRDIMAGADAVVAAGIADPDKMAEWGWSYGGYMTCWIVSQTGRFKAAMMGAGLSDLVSMYGTTDIPNYLGGFFNGYPDAATMRLYRERSGLTYVDQVTTPLLILQGANDERVPTSQSLEFFRALKERGKTVRLFFYPREHHGFTEYYHILDRYQRIYDWLSHYTLGTEPVAPADPE